VCVLLLEPLLGAILAFTPRPRTLITQAATRIDLPNLFHTGDICLTRLRPDKPKITAVLGSTLPHLIDC
jgi:hypothetical protein